MKAMDRLQKKCLSTSAALHALLLGLLLIGPAFFVARPKPQPQETGVFLLIDSARIVDGSFSGGGGNPNARPLPPAPAPTPTQPAPAVQREPPKAAPETTPEPAPVKPITPAVTQQEAGPAKPATPKVKVNSTVISRKAGSPNNSPKVIAQSSKSGSPSRAASSKAAAQKVDSTFQEALRSLEGGLSSGTVVDIPGPGGEAYVSYRDVVKSAYNRAWLPPDEIQDESLTAVADVVVRRDGKILSSPALVQSTGVAAFDHSVKEALERVRYAGLPPFPDGARDDERTFRIKFNLRSKRLSA
jgi:outer membrane biosynthesis protein TonB